MGQERKRDRWLGERSEEWVGAEGAVGLGPKQSAQLRRWRAARKQFDWLVLSAAFFGGLVLGASMCCQVLRRRDPRGTSHAADAAADV